jgi:hypothetical protein
MQSWKGPRKCCLRPSQRSWPPPRLSIGNKAWWSRCHFERPPSFAQRSGLALQCLQCSPGGGRGHLQLDYGVATLLYATPMGAKKTRMVVWWRLAWAAVCSTACKTTPLPTAASKRSKRSRRRICAAFPRMQAQVLAIRPMGRRYPGAKTRLCLCQCKRRHPVEQSHQWAKHNNPVQKRPSERRGTRRYVGTSRKK